MKWSLRIARIAGIDVYLHWTFLILLGWIFLAYLQPDQEGGHGLTGFWFILALFACVLLHEFGHALAARRFGILTRNITLLPIGGVANIEKLPEKPGQELVVALAGPAVNLIIAGIVLAVLLALGKMPSLRFVGEVINQVTPSNFLFNLLIVNIMLFAFNLIPAFPMDGGRVLRAVLAMRFDRVKATQIAAQIGQFLAIIFVFLGFYYNFWLVFIGLFIFLGAGAESNYVATESVLSRFTVREATMHHYITFHAYESIEKAVDTLLDGQEKEFLVTEGNEITGILTREDIIRGLQQYGKDTAVGRIANKNFLQLSPDMLLSEAYQEMIRQNASICPVFEGRELLGVLDRENILEVLMVESARSQRAAI